MCYSNLNKTAYFKISIFPKSAITESEYESPNQPSFCMNNDGKIHLPLSVQGQAEIGIVLLGLTLEGSLYLFVGWAVPTFDSHIQRYLVGTVHPTTRYFCNVRVNIAR